MRLKIHMLVSRIVQILKTQMRFIMNSPHTILFRSLNSVWNVGFSVEIKTFAITCLIQTGVLNSAFWVIQCDEQLSISSNLIYGSSFARIHLQISTNWKLFQLYKIMKFHDLLMEIFWIEIEFHHFPTAEMKYLYEPFITNGISIH